MQVDYAELYYEMLVTGSTLHTFMDAPFSTDNKNMAKKIFGTLNFQHLSVFLSILDLPFNLSIHEPCTFLRLIFRHG